MSELHDIAALQNIIGHDFADPSLLADALTHSSTGGDHNYERLEFLGDRVLGLVVAEILYAKFPAEAEGDLARRLSALVQGTLLAQLGLELGLGAHLLFSDSERQAGGAQNENILADAMESIIGALYLDAGLPACQEFITRAWGDRFETMLTPPQHPKTGLQEWAQAQNLPLPEYKITGQSGPDHAPLFDLTLSVQGYAPISVQGKSRQTAEKEAAMAFLTILEDKKL